MKLFISFIRSGIWSLLSLLMMIFVVVIVMLFYLESQLPDIQHIDDISLQLPMRIYTADGQLIEEFGAERRQPVSLDQVPKPLIEAVLAIEDQRFFEHSGVDIIGLARAAKQLLVTGSKQQGGSTITMQVARNFFLTNEKTYTRKLKEILLAIKLDQSYSKGKILELYLNKIYFGNRAYGVAAAAATYYGKTLEQLTLPEMAMLAGLPKAPSAINPIANPKAALQRRNLVLARMYELGYIDKTTYEQAAESPVEARYHGLRSTVEAPYVAEMARSAVVERFGNKVYNQGLQVYTTIDSKLQTAANQALRKALLAYDQRHGYRGPEGSISRDADDLEDWLDKLRDIPTINSLQPAAVLKVADKSITALLPSGDEINIGWNGLAWARPATNHAWPGKAPKRAGDILKEGDIIRVEEQKEGQWRLAQVPEIEGSLISLDPQTGAIKALVGGFSYEKSKFNRAIQAERQAGSAFKPFIYAAALAKGFTLASIINDAPIVVDDPSRSTPWRPQNNERVFHGPTRLKAGLAFSRNLVSIRLLDAVGIPYTIDFLKKFGFDPKKLPPSLSLALGTADVTPLQYAAAYSIIANGGFQISPYIVNKITDLEGKNFYTAKPKIACPQCEDENNTPTENEIVLTEGPAPRVISPQIDFLITSAMQDVVHFGTGHSAMSLNRNDLAGKTGTAHDQFDAWFTGFNSKLLTIAWVGFDQPKTTYEYGAQAALPMWIDFMRVALQNQPEASLAQPKGIVSVKIDPITGLLARPDQTNAIFEYFTEDTVPKETAPEATPDLYEIAASSSSEQGDVQALYEGD